MISNRPSTPRSVPQLRFAQWFAGVLSAGATGVALSAHAQFDTFGGDPSTNAFIRIPADTDDWTRHFRLGAMVGMNIHANFTTQGTFSPSGSPYSDGYVVKNPNSPYTSDWGYDVANAYTPGNPGTLTLHGVSSYTTENGGLTSQGNGGAIPGLDMAYGGNLWYWKHARVGWELGFGWLPISINGGSSGTVTADALTYKFNTGDIIVPVAPGSTYQGGSLGYGPSIQSTAYVTNSTTSANSPFSSSDKLDVNLFTLRLGPSIYWDVTDRTGVEFGIGPAVGLVEGDLKYNDTVDIGSIPTQNSGHISGADFTYGGYVNATLMYHLVNNGDIYIGAQYMPMEDATISGGGRSGQLNLGGQLYFSLGLNWPF